MRSRGKAYKSGVLPMMEGNNMPVFYMYQRPLMSMTNKSRIHLEPWGQHRFTFYVSSCLSSPLPYLALMAPKAINCLFNPSLATQGRVIAE